jgi:dolichyl-diphosphooligosaccharide--protein glycosyltransferase
MVDFNLKNRRVYLIVGLITFFAVFALLLRLLPMFGMGHGDILSMVASDDPMYNLRQVEQILANFPGYAWFDPMTLFPTGSSIYWGPFFPTIVVVFCLLTGATTRPEIIGTALVVPPLMAAVIVALMYPVGKSFGDWKTGILASGFTAVVSGQFFFRSFFGYLDHHIAEVLFSTLFCLMYVYTIRPDKETKIELDDFGSYKKLLILSFFAGIAYLLGLFTMPTMILFALIVGLFTIVQFIIDAYRGNSSEYLLISNVVVFATAIVGLLIFGIKSSGINLSDYTIGHVYAYLMLIFGTAVLYFLAGYFRGKAKYLFPGTLAGLGVLFVLVLYAASSQLFNLFVGALVNFFGQQPVTNTVLEAIGWNWGEAWSSFGFGLILFAGGALVMIYNNVKDEHPHQVFALVWSLVMFYSTWQHVRYEYYLAVNIALLAAVCTSFVLGRGWKDILKLVYGAALVPDSDGDRKNESLRGKKQKKPGKKAGSRSGPDYILVGSCVLVIALGVFFAYNSVSTNYSAASGGGLRMNPEWRESLDWLANNTPDTGVNYFTIYDPKTFSYPLQAYGVMSWWDYGHMITYISKRIPNANPFQSGVAGPDGAAAFFVTTSEDTANQILDHDGTRFIITDYEMDLSKFPAMATWFNSTANASPYVKPLFVPSQADQNQVQSFLFTEGPYYQTMISRLHNFDGSFTKATTALYVEYADPGSTGLQLPVVTNARSMNVSDAAAQADQFNNKSLSGKHAEVLQDGSIVWLPIDDVPALRHYRLIHESPTNVVELYYHETTPDIKYVKVFEYVKGAHIKGTGVIEVPVVSNTGRNFTYRQESVNGEFVVPYSTTGNSYGVKTTGKYRINGEGKEYDVQESAVIQGTAIS